jgi:hypothetical protein
MAWVYTQVIGCAGEQALAYHCNPTYHFTHAHVHPPVQDWRESHVQQVKHNYWQYTKTVFGVRAEEVLLEEGFG